MMIDEFSLIKSIGKGEFGEVYLSSKKGSNQLFATKKVSKQKIQSPSIKKYFLNEITILKELQHKNIIRLETIRQTVHNFYIITEFYNGGNLSDCLRKHRMLKGKPFSEDIVQHIMRQAIDALKYLHSKRIIHRDLKLENMLMNFESEEDKKNLNMLKADVKIIDFGFATFLDNAGLRYSVLGSPINMDPILLTKLINQNLTNLTGYNEKADIWSLGTVCFELITGKPIFNAQNVTDLVRLVELGFYHIPTNLSQEMVSFLEAMLQYTSSYRLSAEELSNHPFLTKNVYEFKKLDLTNYANRIDVKGIILNIKKNPGVEKPVFDVSTRLNYIHQQQIYQNFRNNNNIYPPAYNYYATGPKYYKATTNNYKETNNNRPPLNQYQLNTPAVPTQGAINNYQNQNNININTQYNLNNQNINTQQNLNNQNINIQHNINNQNINTQHNLNNQNINTQHNLNNQNINTQNNLNNQNINTQHNLNNHNINNQFYAKNQNNHTNQLMRQGYTYQDKNYIQKHQINKANTLPTNPKFNNITSQQNHHYITNNENKNYINSNLTIDPNNYEKIKEKEGLLRKGARFPLKTESAKNLPVEIIDTYNSKYRSKKANSLEKANNHKKKEYNNKPILNNFYTQFNQNSAGVPPLSDAINPSPIPFTGKININNPMYNNPVPYPGMDDQISANIHRNHHQTNNSLMNNASIRRHSANRGSTNEMKKEISSDALDNLFDFNIGKNLEPEPEMEIEK